MFKKIILLTILVAILAFSFSCQRNSQSSKKTSQTKKIAKNSVTLSKGEIASLRAFFKPLPAFMTDDNKRPNEKLLSLGEKLYFEKKLSLANDISCNSCHGLDTFGVDNKPTSPGHKNQLGDRNSPTVYNAALHIAQFWDGRAKDVEAQALGPILNPVEMAMPSEEAVIAKLKADSVYPDLFKAAFPEDEDSLTYDNIGKAIGAFERTLVTPSRYDKFLQGDDTALTFEEQAGLLTFQKTGCVACHMGATLGGTQYQKLGLVKPYKTKDTGRFNETKKDVDKMVFKVPSLRNISKTGPYLHDGSIESLDEMVKLMAEYQLGKDLSDEHTKSIVAFLNSLTGELPEKYRK